MQSGKSDTINYELNYYCNSSNSRTSHLQSACTTRYIQSFALSYWDRLFLLGKRYRGLFHMQCPSRSLGFIYIKKTQIGRKSESFQNTILFPPHLFFVNPAS